MHEYYHPSSEPNWVNDDWLRLNTSYDPDTTPVEALADAGFFQLKMEGPDNSHSPRLYIYSWKEKIQYPYCIKFVDSYIPLPLEQGKEWMLQLHPDHEADIKAATSIDELQQILDSIS